MTQEVKHLQLEYAPDNNPEAQGVILDCTNMIPGTNGYKGAMAGNAVTAALAALPVGAAYVRLLDDSSRIFAATATKLYELTSGYSWTDVSKGGGTYSNSTYWRFAQFGNDTIATNRVDPVQVSATSGAFANLGGSPPKAAIVEVCNGFVFLLDYNDGVNDYGDGWWCSALRNDASWSPSIATQAANGRLVDSTGRIRGGKALGNLMIIYKEKSMYVGYYDGAPVIWRWELLPGQIGAISQEAIVNTGTMHIFAGFDDFYMMDGSRPVSIGMGKVRDFWNDDCSQTYKYKTVAQHDLVNGVVYFRYVSAPSTTGKLDRCLAYNYKVGKWGRDDKDVSVCVEYISGGVTYNSLGSQYSTYDSLPAISYDSPFWSSGNQSIAYFKTTTFELNVLASGYTNSSTLSMGWVGDEHKYTTLTQCRIRLSSDVQSALTSASAKHYTTEMIGTNNPTLSETVNSDTTKRRFDFDRSSLWHQVVFNFTWSNDFELTGITYYYEPDGEQ